MLQSINPANNELLGEFEEHSFEQVEDIIQAANNAQKAWKIESFEVRAKYLNKLSELLLKEKDVLASLMASEMGKPLAQGMGEIEKCAWLCSFYAKEAADFLNDEVVETTAKKSYVHFEPLGVILSVMPWNFPVWQVLRFSAPALMAGNAVILKHSENTSGCSIKIEELMHEAGYPVDLFRSILVDKEHMKPIIQHPGIAAITLTGSTKAGKTVAAQAGEALKKTVLELGGSDPYLIFEDANLEMAADICATSRLVNSGQSCVAAKRFIVVDEVYEEFIQKFTDALSARTVGDPFSNEHQVGPLARLDLKEQLHEQVEESIKQGAVLHYQSDPVEEQDAFYPITILTNVSKGMPAYSEELFGPVAAVIKVKNEEEAIFVANDTNYGLGAAIFSMDESRAEHIAATKLDAGCCFVNSMVKSDPRLPFGGIKDSGYGRELGLFGIREFVNVKTVWVQ